MDPQEILDRTETCRELGISRQTLNSWINKGKIKVWKRVGHGSNAALLFARQEINSLRASRDLNVIKNEKPSTDPAKQVEISMPERVTT